MSIFQTLIKDHDEVKSILKKIDETTERAHKTRLDLIQKLKEAVVPHARAEEAVLYEAMKKSEMKDADDLGYEGYEEHSVVDHLFEEIDNTAPEDKRWTALSSVMKEVLEHHIKEEENQMFKKARKAFNPEVAQEMEEQFIELKKSFLAEVKKGSAVAPMPSHSIDRGLNEARH